MDGYSVDCNLCHGDGVAPGFKGADIRCSKCFPAGYASDVNKLAKFDLDEIAGVFDEDEYDTWWRRVRMEMRQCAAFAQEDDRRRSAMQQQNLDIERRTAERLKGVFGV